MQEKIRNAELVIPRQRKLRQEETHHSGTVIHWGERDPDSPGFRVAITCYHCRHKSFTYIHNTKRLSWTGLCHNCVRSGTRHHGEHRTLNSDQQLSTGSIVHWLERYSIPVNGPERVRSYVPVTCGKCMVKRPVIQSSISEHFSGYHRKCNKKHINDLTLASGSIIHWSKREQGSVPVTCGRCGRTRKHGTNDIGITFTGYHHGCALGTRVRDEEHISGARVLWSKREVQRLNGKATVPLNKVKVPFICKECRAHSLIWPHQIGPKWSGLCEGCRCRRGSPRRFSADVELWTGSRILYSRRQGDRVPVICGLPSCGAEHLLHRKQMTGHRGKGFTGFCQTHTRREVILALQAQAYNGDKQIVGGPSRRGRGRTPKPLAVKQAELERRKIEFEDKVRQLGRRLFQRQITRAVVADEYANARGEIPEESTIGKWVRDFYGKGISVPDAVSRILAGSRINTEFLRENKSPI
jgi:hypothetical protein